jgi:hypothetical protein
LPFVKVLEGAVCVAWVHFSAVKWDLCRSVKMKLSR